MDEFTMHAHGGPTPMDDPREGWTPRQWLADYEWKATFYASIGCVAEAMQYRAKAAALRSELALDGLGVTPPAAA